MGNEMVLAALLLSRGQVQEAERRFASIHGRAGSRGWMGARIAAAAGLGRIRLANGDARGAADATVPGLEVLARKGVWIWGREIVPVAVRALAACGELTEASALTDRYVSGVRGRDAPAARAAGLTCQAEIACAQDQHMAAARRFALAELASTELPAPYEAAAARAGRGGCLLAAGDATGADLLVSALKAFEELGASWDATRARATLRAHDVAVPAQWRGGRRAYGDELSPREAEVAELAGMGRKNREIAEALFISPRTVETHVASALRKLGAPSRDALATAMADHARQAP